MALGRRNSSPAHLTAVGTTLFFTIDLDDGSGGELWKSDGTASGTVLVKDIRPGKRCGLLLNLTSVGGALFFTANDGIHGEEPWRSDGTSSGTALVRDIRSDSKSSSPNWLRDVGGTLFFVAN